MFVRRGGVLFTFIIYFLIDKILARISHLPRAHGNSKLKFLALLQNGWEKTIAIIAIHKKLHFLPFAIKTKTTSLLLGFFDIDITHSPSFQPSQLSSAMIDNRRQNLTSIDVN